MDPELLKECEVRDFKKGDIILKQEDDANGMYVIKSGKVAVEMDGKFIATLEEGEFFGEMALMLHEPRNATIRVMSDELSTHFISKETFGKVKEELGEEVTVKILQRIIENCDRKI